MRQTKRNAAAWAALIVAGLFVSPAHGAAIIYNLGTLGGFISYGYGLNDAGHVAGSGQLAGNDHYSHAFRYDGTPGSGGVMRDLGTLGGANSEALGVNNAGQVAGSSQLSGNHFGGRRNVGGG